MFDPTEAILKVAFDEISKINQDLIRRFIRSRARYLPEDVRADDIEAWTTELDHIQSIPGAWAHAFEIHWTVRSSQATETGTIYNQAADVNRLLKNLALIAGLPGFVLAFFIHDLSPFWMNMFMSSMAVTIMFMTPEAVPTRRELFLFLWRENKIFPGTSRISRAGCALVIGSFIVNIGAFLSLIGVLFISHVPVNILLASVCLPVCIALTAWMHELKNNFAEKQR